MGRQVTTQAVAREIEAFVRRRRSHPEQADLSVLTGLRLTVEANLEQTDMAAEAVHNAFGLYWLLRDRESALDLLRDYLKRELRVSEEAWARWNLVDHLALLRRSDDLHEAHRDFLAWAHDHLPAERLPWVVHDATQALRWFAGGYGDEWMGMYRRVCQQAPATSENRTHRCYMHLAAAYTLPRYGGPEEALGVAEDLRAVAAEDPGWEYAPYWNGMALCRRLEAHLALGQRASVERDLTEMDTHLSALAQQFSQAGIGHEAASAPQAPLHPAKRLGRYRTERMHRDPVIAYQYLSHDTGAVLYRAQEYHLAIPFLARAIEAGHTSFLTYAWRAACVWVVERDYDKVAQNLRRAAEYSLRSGDYWKQLPELRGVADDPRLEQLLTD